MARPEAGIRVVALVRIELTEKKLKWLSAQQILFSNTEQPRIKVGDILTFDDEVEVEPYVGFNAGFAICAMGFLSYTNSQVPQDLNVGRYCSLAGNIRFGGFRHPVEYLSTSIFTYDRRNSLVTRVMAENQSPYNSFKVATQKKQITINHDVWIGRDVSIMPGVNIGTGSVIASAAVVTRDVPPYSIMGGNPAKLIRKRFPQEIIEALLESQWWNYKFTDFAGLNVSDPELFLREFRSGDLAEYKPIRIKMREIVEV
ncbi:hexapeptide transferase [Acidisoma sp. 7E03]